MTTDTPPWRCTLFHQKTFSSGGTQRYRATFAYDTLKRDVANDLFDDLNSQVVQDSWTYDLLGNFQETNTAGVGQQWDASVRFSEPAYIDDLNGNQYALRPLGEHAELGDMA